ncbi:MAG: ABC transporter substrate-binding protein [bacterium]
MRINSLILLSILSIFVNLSNVNAEIIGKDDFGKAIVLDKLPKRIVVTSATVIPIIFEMGAGDKIVGVPEKIDSSYTWICEKYPQLLDKPRVGNFSNPSIEKIVSLSPDLVICYDSLETPGKYTQGFKKWGIPYASFGSVRDMSHGIEQIKRLGVLLGKKKEAERLTKRIQAEISKLAEPVMPLSYKPLVYVWWGSGNLTYGKPTIVNELIDMAGGINLAGDINRQCPEISSEYVISKNPDVIIITCWKEEDKKTRIDAIKEKPCFNQVKAVKNNRVYVIDGNSVHSIVRFPEALRNLIKFIHPEMDIKGANQ